ncbi:MAG: hypothetical protein ACYC9Q_09235 [Bacillota bacterium]
MGEILGVPSTYRAVAPRERVKPTPPAANTGWRQARLRELANQGVTARLVTNRRNQTYISYCV